MIAVSTYVYSLPAAVLPDDYVSTYGCAYEVAGAMVNLLDIRISLSPGCV
jgi:hypothetical protein